MGRAEAQRAEVVGPGDLVQQANQQTPGLVRKQAFAADDRWMGYVSAEPGEWGGWHHHGATDTYFYVLRGGFDFQFGVSGETIEVRTGEFCHVPAGLVHRERPQHGEGAEVILVRVGEGPTVVNVESPGK